MEKIPTSFMGYKKQAVNDILKEHERVNNTQKQDIKYLRSEISRLEKQLKNKK